MSEDSLDLRDTGLLEAFNARAMSAAAVARSFVVPTQFDELTAEGNSYLIGPRGSGKTTLLRMLRGRELGLWDDPEASRYRERISYSSVFVPADRLWMRQFVDDSGQTDRPKLGSCAFSTQIVLALLETVQYRASESAHPVMHPVDLSLTQEASIVAHCAEAWHLHLSTHSIDALIAKLEIMLLRIGNLVNENVRIEEADPQTSQFLGSIQSPLSSLAFAVRQINRELGQPEHRWALLLDEMELAPPALHKALIQATRGGPPEIFFKLSFSPFDEFGGAQREYVGTATETNDFRAIHLWSSDRHASRRFAEGVFQRVATDVLKSPKSSLEVLGPSLIDSFGSTWHLRRHDNEGDKARLVREMAMRDPSFRAYVSRRDIDLNDIEHMSYNRKSATLRRFYPLLVFREAFLDFQGDVVAKRGRNKTPELMGQSTVLSALEGNPRWMKAAFSQMLRSYREGASPPVHEGAQFDALADAANSFVALLRLLPEEYQGRGAPVLELLDSIASYFNRRALGPFTADPPTVFVVDKDVPPSVHYAIQASLYAGAIVHLRGPESPPILSNVLGERFRLAYLLCLRDRLEVPMLIGKEVRLSKILQDTSAWSPTLFELDSYDS